MVGCQRSAPLTAFVASQVAVGRNTQTQNWWSHSLESPLLTWKMHETGPRKDVPRNPNIQTVLLFHFH